MTTASARTLMTYRDMALRLKADYLADRPEVIDYRPADGGRTKIYGASDYDGDAGARAITLAVTAGDDDKNVYRQVEHYLRTRMSDRLNRTLSKLPKHSHWDIRSDALWLLAEMVKVYEWKKGSGAQPTLTEALDRWGSGVAPVSRKRYRLYGAAYLDRATRTAFDVYDPRLYLLPKTGTYADNPAAGQDDNGVDLFDPAGYQAREYRVRFYYARAGG